MTPSDLSRRCAVAALAAGGLAVASLTILITTSALSVATPSASAATSLWQTVSTGPATSTAPAPSAGTASAWLPYWDQARGYQAFLANASLFRELDPFWYELSAQGTLATYPGVGDPAIVNGAHEVGVLVIPTISNAFDAQRVHTLLATAASRAAHEQALVALAVAHRYDGIDVDYESLLASDRSALTAFVAELAGRLHAVGKQLEVTVHAKTSEPGSWTGPQAQNYAAIGAAADRVQVMAYDYSYNGGPAGPIAPLPWVNAVAAFAASQINPAKVELGMPLYAYDWVGTHATSLTFEQVKALLASTGSTARWSATDGAKTFSYRAAGVAHTVWFSDAASIGAALPVVAKHHLAGVALWALTGPDPALWAQLGHPVTRG